MHMKKRIALLMASSLLLNATGCKQNSYFEIAYKIVEPTCVSEGYIEHVMNNGYVYRDNIIEPSQHHYIDFELKGENPAVYSVCSFCGLLKGYETGNVEINTDVCIDRARKKPSFINHDHMVVSMISEKTLESAILKIRLSETHGAHGIMLYLTALDEKYRNIDDLEKIMYCTNLPILVIAYDLPDLLRMGVQAGACAIDMPGYLFDDYNSIASSNKELKNYYSDAGVDVSFVECDAKEISLKPEIINKQRQFVDEMHNIGAEVLYSAHTRVEMTSSQIVSAAKFAKNLGVDAVKIVCEGTSKETVIEHLKSIRILEQELDIKFSVHGQSTLSRLLGPLFGSYIAYCVDDYVHDETNIQIDLATMISILNSPDLADNF